MNDRVEIVVTAVPADSRWQELADRSGRLITMGVLGLLVGGGAAGILAVLGTSGLLGAAAVVLLALVGLLGVVSVVLGVLGRVMYRRYLASARARAPERTDHTRPAELR